MKTLIKLLFVMFLPIGICDADAACGNSTKQDYITALINTDYEVRNKALLDLHECPDKLSTPEIQQAILNLVDREIKIDTQWYKDDKAGKNPPSLGEDYGDYLIDLQKTLFSISDNPKTLHALLDSTSISGWNIDDRLVKTYGEKLVPGLARQFNNKTMWKENRLEILGLVERLNEEVKLSSDSHKQLREIVLGGLSYPKPSTQGIAIKVAASSVYDDDEIIAKIETLSSNKSLQKSATKALAILRANRQRSVSTSTGVINVQLSGSTNAQ